MENLIIFKLMISEHWSVLHPMEFLCILFFMYSHFIFLNEGEGTRDLPKLKHFLPLCTKMNGLLICDHNDLLRETLQGMI